MRGWLPRVAHALGRTLAAVMMMMVVAVVMAGTKALFEKLFVGDFACHCPLKNFDVLFVSEVKPSIAPTRVFGWMVGALHLALGWS